jgi:hypothetical protein
LGKTHEKSLPSLRFKPDEGTVVNTLGASKLMNYLHTCSYAAPKVAPRKSDGAKIPPTRPLPSELAVKVSLRDVSVRSESHESLESFLKIFPSVS